LSYGKEHVPVPCVNNVDNELPSYVTYSTKREATAGVDLNLEPEYLIGCDCTDDCQVGYSSEQLHSIKSVLTLCITLILILCGEGVPAFQHMLQTALYLDAGWLARGQ
jgi:hypothetical protein